MDMPTSGVTPYGSDETDHPSPMQLLEDKPARMTAADKIIFITVR